LNFYHLIFLIFKDRSWYPKKLCAVISCWRL